MAAHKGWHFDTEMSELQQHFVMNAWPVKQEVDAQVRKVEYGVHTIVEYPTNLENHRKTVESVKSINPGTEGLALLQRKVRTATALGNECCAAWETRSRRTGRKGGT
jgi:hypothetical protein